MIPILRAAANSLLSGEKAMSLTRLISSLKYLSLPFADFVFGEPTNLGLVVNNPPRQYGGADLGVSEIDPASLSFGGHGLCLGAP